MTSIIEFKGEYHWLSNFWIHPIFYDVLIYPSNENAYQAMKCEQKYMRLFFVNISPYVAKKLGCQVKLRSDWNEKKEQIMYEINRCKYQDIQLRQKLLNTNNLELIEGNTWNDTYWGICNGIGENKLGKILMRIRDECKSIY